MSEVFQTQKTQGGWYYRKQGIHKEFCWGGISYKAATLKNKGGWQPYENRPCEPEMEDNVKTDFKDNSVWWRYGTGLIGSD